MVKIYWLVSEWAINCSLSVDGVVLLVQGDVGGLGVIDGQSLAAQPGIVLSGTLGISGLLDVNVALLELLVQAVELQVHLRWGLLAESLGLLEDSVEL